MKLLKLFLLPTPVELGKSDYNALPTEMFPNDVEYEYTWEEYDRTMQKQHPILWFLNRTVPKFWRRYVWGTYAPLERARYWLVSHLVPSRRYHLLDLRQPGVGEYKFGWIDSDRQIVYANFAILKKYVEVELEGKFPIQDENEWEGAKIWNEHYREVESLYHYWMVERPAWMKRIDQLSVDAYDNRRNLKNTKKSTSLYELVRQEEEKFDKAETDALVRIIKVRKGMWT